MLSEFKKKHIHREEFYLRGDKFKQALLVMLVTNITSGGLRIGENLSSRSMLKDYLQQPQNAQKANKAKMEKCQFVELKTFTSVRVLDT